MKKLFAFGYACFFFCFYGYAQDQANTQAFNKSGFPQVNLGIGLGTDYGGIGGRLSVLPIDRFSLFGAVGYNIAGAGYSFGTTLRISPNKSFCPYLIGMYGHNTVVVVLINGEYEPDFTKAFKGPTVGIGFEQHGSSTSKSYFNLAVLVPFRSSEFRAYKKSLEDHYDTKFYGLPIGLSVGYHVGF